MKKLLLLMPLLVLFVGCSQDINSDAEDPKKAAIVELEKVDGRVVRYDCDKNVISDKDEMVIRPVKTINIVPKRSLEVIDSEIKNLTTNSKGIIYNMTHIRVSTIPNIWHYSATEGLNEISYTYEYSDGKTESGSRYIDIYVNESYKEEVTEIHPYPDECEEEEK